ncbi:MAG: RsmB/NOP family class I SAM-dependent RNA methyltransferase [Rhizobiaceae bacterium]|nr:RsmB/NOP family class I SAM-dependent RNA methyltransferase [Rhizobiaceae bacterium]
MVVSGRPASDGRSHRTSKGRAPVSKPADDVPGLAARMAAARLLAAVIDARTPLDGLTDAENGHPQFRALEGRDRGLVRAILTTALRFRVTIETMIGRQIERPLPANATTLTHILHVAAAQILFLDVPDSAAVDLAVTHAKGDPRTQRFAGLVNGVLRSVARAKDRSLEKTLAATTDTPEWFRERLANAYGAEKARAILAAHRYEAPFDFSVKDDSTGWAAKLGGFVLPTGSIRLANLPASVPDLPGFAEGAWWVQDAAAALPARLLGDVRGLRVADLCAAPGGKTAQIALAGAHVTAVDLSKNRLARLETNLVRLGLAAQTIQADLMSYRPDDAFDAILLDAPCSSTGTVRRHPDVPWTKSPEDIAKLADLQARLLRRALTMLKPGGTLVFSNCSLDPLEGEVVVREFLAESRGVRLDPVRRDEIPGIESFVTPEGFLRTTPADFVFSEPGISGLDGFFAARFVSTA